MSQELDICNRVYEIATYNMRRTIRKNTAKENEAMKQVVCQSYILYEFKELSQILGEFMFADKCKPQ